MMPINKTDNRRQTYITCLEEEVDTDNEVRVIDALIDLADLESLGFKIKGTSHVGAPAYDIYDLVKLYSYGYLYGIRSSHTLEKACRVNVEVRWLVKGKTPCQKTISDFRAVNGQALKQFFFWFNRFLMQQGCFKDDVYALDGAFIHGQNSRDKHYSKKKLKDRLSRLERKISAYLEELEQSDISDADTKNLQASLLALNSSQEQFEELNAAMEAADVNQLSMTDPDARLLYKRSGGHGVSVIGYNIQAVADTEHKMIASFEVTNEVDKQSLSKMAIQTKETLAKAGITLLADTGYESATELMKCATNDIKTLVSPKVNRSRKPKGFRKQDFTYDREKDCYICPAGQELPKVGKLLEKKNKIKIQHYTCPVSLCKKCPYKDQCVTETTLKRRHGRTVRRQEHENYVEENSARIAKNPELYRKRKATIEHPFGTIKRTRGYYYTLLRGFEKVKAEFALIFFTYNLRRAMSIFGISELLERIRALFVCINPISDLTESVGHVVIEFNNEPHRLRAA